MQRVAHLLAALDTGLDAHACTQAIARLLDTLPTEDAAWAVHLLGGGRALRPAPQPEVLRQAALQACGLPEWLFDTSVASVGDLAEAIALLLPPDAPVPGPSPTLTSWIEESLAPLSGLPAAPQAERLARTWLALEPGCRELGIRLATGRLKPLPTTEALQAAVAVHANLPRPVVAQRWSTWQSQRRPSRASWQALRARVGRDEHTSPGRLSPWPVLDLPESERAARLGPIGDWLLTVDEGGVPVRLLRQGGRTRLWSADERLLDAGFPDLIDAAAALPAGIELVGTLLPAAWGGSLQPRLGQVPPSPALVRRTPVRLQGLDLLVLDGVDLRGLPLTQRHQKLGTLLGVDPGAPWAVAPECRLDDWAGAQGLLARRRSAGVDEVGEHAWRLPLEPLRVAALLLHAQAGTGRDAGLYVDSTLAVWNRAPADEAEVAAVIEAIARQLPRNASGSGLELVPLARTAVGLGPDERGRIDRWARANTVARHGPVRSLRPGLVVTLAFDGIEASTRRRSGLVLQAPRLLGLREDLAPHQADDLAALQARVDQRRTRLGCQ